MWYGIRMSARADADFITSAAELLRSTSRQVILLMSGGFVAWYFLGIVGLPDRLMLRVFPITVLIVLACICSLWLLSRSTLAAQVVWQVGLAAAITLAVYLFQRPEVAFFYALLPFIGVVSIGWPGALLSGGLVTVLVGWFTLSPAISAFPPTYGTVITTGAAITGVIGWVATRSLLTVTQWSLFSLERAQQKVKEARDQRLELKQVQQDLILATSELARLSDRLKALHQVAEEARRAKEAFVANVSHELRTPLNMIIGFSEMITELPQVYGAKLPPALLADVAAIQRNSQHLAKLVDDVLDLSRVEAGRMALSKEWASLQEVTDEAALAVRALFESKGLYLETAVPTDLPRVFCDSTRIRQVVLNLLSNAGRLTAQGGVRVSAQSAKGEVVVSVADTGPGITPDDQSKLFEPFRRLDDLTSRSHDGSGLGLSISKQFVEMHGGRMWLDSKVGVGTTFHFSLPMDTASSAELSKGEDVGRWFSPYHQYDARTRRSKAPAPTMVPRFVVLEQGESLRRLFRRYLDDIEIVSVQDGEEATRQLSQSPARALIVNAPSLKEAMASLDQLARLPYGTPAIVCWLPGLDEAAKKLGVVRYLVKPVSRDTLLLTLAHLGEGVQSVLLVDDEPEILQLFARMLSTTEYGYRILQATTGERALSLLRERRPDVMLLDLIMPGMDGFAVLQAKGEDPSISGIPVIVVSSRDPAGEPIVSDTLAVTRGGGLTVRELLTCIQAISDALSPSLRSDRREPPETPAE